MQSNRPAGVEHKLVKFCRKHSYDMIYTILFACMRLFYQLRHDGLVRIYWFHAAGPIHTHIHIHDLGLGLGLGDFGPCQDFFSVRRIGKESWEEKEKSEVRRGKYHIIIIIIPTE